MEYHKSGRLEKIILLNFQVSKNGKITEVNMNDTHEPYLMKGILLDKLDGIS